MRKHEVGLLTKYGCLVKQQLDSFRDVTELVKISSRLEN